MTSCKYRPVGELSYLYGLDQNGNRRDPEERRPHRDLVVKIIGEMTVRTFSEAAIDRELFKYGHHLTEWDRLFFGLLFPTLESDISLPERDVSPAHQHNHQ